MSYLARLRDGSPAKTPALTTVLTAKRAFDSFGSNPSESISAYAATFYRWRVTTPTGAAMEVLFHPEATRAEVAALYRSASIEPLPESAKRTATPAEAAELRELVAIVADDWPDADRAEALAVALADLEAALTCWRALVVEQRLMRNEPARNVLAPPPQDRSRLQAPSERLRDDDGTRHACGSWVNAS